MNLYCYTEWLCTVYFTMFPAWIWKKKKKKFRNSIHIIFILPIRLSDNRAFGWTNEWTTKRSIDQWMDGWMDVLVLVLCTRHYQFRTFYKAEQSINQIRVKDYIIINKWQKNENFWFTRWHTYWVQLLHQVWYWSSEGVKRDWADNTLGSKEMFDLDLWTCDLKINRDHLLFEGNSCTKFGIDQVKGSKDIERTTQWAEKSGLRRVVWPWPLNMWPENQ